MGKQNSFSKRIMGRYSNIRIPKTLVACEYYDIPQMKWFKKE